MEICKRGPKLGKSRLSNTKLINFGYPVDIFINLFQAVGQRILRQCIAYVLYFRNNNNIKSKMFGLLQISLKRITIVKFSVGHRRESFVPFLVSMHFTIQNKTKIVLKF